MKQTWILRRLLPFITFLVLFSQTITAAAATCPFYRPPGFVEISGVVRYTYTVGEAYRSNDVGLIIYDERSHRYYADNLEYWLNGSRIYNGYKFKTVGNKNITVKRYDKQAQYQLQVVPVLNGSLKECIIETPPSKTSYLQNTEGFDPKDIVVKCVFTDGSVQKLGYKELEFYIGARGMVNHKWGTAILDGYKFKESGEKDLIIRVVNKEMRVPLTVLPVESGASAGMLSDLKAAKNAGILNNSHFIDIQGAIKNTDLAGLTKTLYQELGGSMSVYSPGASPFTDASLNDSSITGAQAAAALTRVMDSINGTAAGDPVAYITQSGAGGSIQDFNASVSREQVYVMAWKLLSMSPQWAAASGGDFPRGTYYLANAGNVNKVADIASSSATEGAWCIMWDKKTSETENQQFILKRKGDAYKLIARHTGMALEAKTSQKEAVLIQRPESDNENQLFKISRNEDGSISLTNFASGLFVGVSANQLQGGPLILWTSANDGSQNFKLIPVQ